MSESAADVLRGMKLPPPRFLNAPMSAKLQTVIGYKHLQTFFPTLTRLFRINKFQSENVWFDTKWRINEIISTGTAGNCEVLLEKNIIDCSSQEFSRMPAYMKVTHLLDPIQWMRGKYSLPKESGLPWHSRTWAHAWHKLQDPWNQAYVETIASYALGKLREEDISPHFNEFYGAFCARANIYRYNLNDDFSSFRNERWFWNGKKRGLYSLIVKDSESPGAPVPSHILEELLIPPSLSDSEGSELSEMDVDAGGELESLDTASIDTEEGEEEDEEEEDEDEDEDQYTVYAEMNDFPVMLILTEQNKNTMDSLLEEGTLDAKPGTERWELYWSSWIFQIIAACSAMQRVFGMTHNDLHTNNIVWVATEKEFLYYKNAAGIIWKVPTFGKIFRIIDFGRSIFTINGTMFVSDDFRPGNDADGQYDFKPLSAKPKEEVLPNPSFDLARLAVSLFEGLFPCRPNDADSKKILSEEEGLVVRETVSPLYNCLWTWMVDDNDSNILMDPDGSERYPDFYLYKHIAAKVHGAVPSKQFEKSPFSQFITKETVEKERIYSLFC